MAFKNMGVVIFGCTLIIGGLVKYKNSKYKEDKALEEEKFWAKEAKSNHVRRKDLSGLDYIKVPLDELPFVQTDNYDIKLCEKELRNIAETKIVNLNGISNTDLKLEYGTANITLLSEYDNNCANLFMALSNMTVHLAENDFHKEAVAFGEYALSIGCDISRVYYVLADEYIKDGRASKVDELIEKAKLIDSPMSAAIVRELEKKML